MLLVTAFAYAVCACYAKGHCMQRVLNAVISVAICYSYYVALYRADEHDYSLSSFGKCEGCTMVCELSAFRR